MWSELGSTWAQLWLTVVSAVGVYLTMMVLSRLFGQRQFASSTTYDLAFTFAMGSLIGRTVLVRVSLLNAVVALCTMFILHAGATWLHHRFGIAHELMQNRPVLLVDRGHCSMTRCTRRAPAASRSSRRYACRAWARSTMSRRWSWSAMGSQRCQPLTAARRRRVR